MEGGEAEDSGIADDLRVQGGGTDTEGGGTSV